MSDNDWKREIGDEVRVFARWVVSSLLDASFLILWIFLQWLVGKAIQIFPLDQIDALQLQIFKVLFAVTTLAPIVFYIVTDISAMFIRTRQRLRQLKKT